MYGPHIKLNTVDDIVASLQFLEDREDAVYSFFSLLSIAKRCGSDADLSHALHHSGAGTGGRALVVDVCSGVVQRFRRAVENNDTGTGSEAEACAFIARDILQHVQAMTQVSGDEQEIALASGGGDMLGVLEGNRIAMLDAVLAAWHDCHELDVARLLSVIDSGFTGLCDALVDFLDTHCPTTDAIWDVAPAQR